jgi:hypothetical protein
VGLRRLGDRVFSLAAGAGRIEGAGHHRRDTGGVVRA